jgi:hypothetical protein
MTTVVTMKHSNVANFHFMAAMKVTKCFFTLVAGAISSGCGQLFDVFPVVQPQTVNYI